MHKLRRDRPASMTGNRRAVEIFAPLPSTRHMRAPVDTIPAPPFPQGLEWVNVKTLRMDKQRGRPVLIEFFDFCRPNSLRTLPYVRAWHERYAEAGAGLRVVSVHCPGFPPGEDADTVRAAVAAAGHRARRCAWTRASRCGAPTTTRAGPRATCSTATSSSSSTTSARAPTPRPSSRSRSCWASAASWSRPCIPRTCPTRRSSARRPTSPAPTRARTRRARCGPSSRARARSR